MANGCDTSAHVSYRSLVRLVRSRCSIAALQDPLTQQDKNNRIPSQKPMHSEISTDVDMSHINRA